jgi:RNA polymerase sigma-70 factor (ECF subfamily)
MAATIEDVWTVFRQRLYSYIRARSRSPQDAEDILQDVFVKIHQRLDTLEDDARLTSWLYRVTHNTIVDYYRKKRPLPTAQEPPAPVEDDIPIAEQRLAPFLGELINGLPAIYREALTLTELEGLTQDEMGHRLGLSTSGAKSRVQRGRAMVRDQLLDCCHVELDRRRHVIAYQAVRNQQWPEECSCAPRSCDQNSAASISGS